MRSHAGVLALGFFFMLVQNYSYMKIPRYMRVILDEIGGKNRGSVVGTNILYIFIFTAVLAVSLFLMRKLIIGVSRKIEYQLREKIFNKLLSLDYLFYRRNETGDLMSRCTNDLDSVRTLLGPGVMYIPNSLSRLVLFLPVLITLSGSLMAILGVIMTLLVIIIVTLLPLLRPHFLKIQEAMGTMNNRVWQVISGISAIKQYTAEKTETERFKGLNEEYIKKQMAVVKLQEFLRPLFFFVMSITELVILWWGGKQVIDGQLTIGELLQFNIMVSYLTFPILALGWMMSLIQEGISAMGRINYILDEPVEDGGKIPLETTEPVFEVRDLTYRYPGHEREVLRGVSLTAAPGGIIGITGKVGSGKTTLINILTGLLKPERGRVFVDGIDICDIEPGSLYDKVAVVSQSPFLFSRTVAENIALGPGDVPMEMIQKAADDAGLSRDIAAFRDGLSQIVGERGITLSGGQKQRVAIARALSKCAPVLVLDDPLSNVDARTEARILQSLESLKCYRTLIIVSHRVSVLRTADMVYVMDDGAVVECGRPASLARRKKGFYARLAKLQQMEMELEKTAMNDER